MTQNRTLSLILPAFGAAIIAALAQIIIPIGAVPITLQTFAVGLVAAVLNRGKLLFLLSPLSYSWRYWFTRFRRRWRWASILLWSFSWLSSCLSFFALVTSALTHAKTPIWKSFWLLFWEMRLSLSVVSLACTFLERWVGLQLWRSV